MLNANIFEVEAEEEPRTLIEVIDLEAEVGPLAQNKNNVCN